MAKRIEKGSYEDKALHKVYSLSSPRNPVVPGRLLESEDACVFLMPLLRPGFFIDRRFVTWPVLTRHIYTVIDVRRHYCELDCIETLTFQGLQFLHENNMAFIVSKQAIMSFGIAYNPTQDVTVPNWVFSLEPMQIKGFDVPGDSIYFIDFEATRILPSGPGFEVKIRDYEQKPAAPPHPPEGMDKLDPYAVDIFKLGGALAWFLEVRCIRAKTCRYQLWFTALPAAGASWTVRPCPQLPNTLPETAPA